MDRKEVQDAVNKISDSDLRTPLAELQDEVGVLQNLAEKWLGEREKKDEEIAKYQKAIREIMGVDWEEKAWIAKVEKYTKLESEYYRLKEEKAQLLNVYRLIKYEGKSLDDFDIAEDHIAIATDCKLGKENEGGTNDLYGL
jgi:hypothetical protein